MRLSPLVLALSMLPPPAQALGSVVASHPLRPLNQSILDIHNRERAAVGAPPLRWNVQLEKDATRHAHQMLQAGRLIHAPREGRGIARENLSQGPLGWGPDQLMRNWLNEKRYFHGGIYPNVCTGGWSQCSHYTQMIWPGTTDIGCGMAAGGRFSWFVCRYSPGGNKDGRWLGEAAYRTPAGTKGPVDSAKSRQRLGTPGQSNSRSNLDRFCNPPAKVVSNEARDKIIEQVNRQKQLEEEIKELQNAILALQAGLADQIKPSLIEKVTGITIGAAPSTEELRVIAARLKQRMEELRVEQERIKGLVRELQKRQKLYSRLCRDE